MSPRMNISKVAPTLTDTEPVELIQTPLLGHPREEMRGIDRSMRFAQVA
jgi:hypothetical protein